MNPSQAGLPRTMTTALIVLAALLVGSMGAPAAQAADSYGTPGPSYSGVTNPPTSDKPQSKLWWNDGSWWAYMWVTNSGWHIQRLDRGAGQWVDTGVLVDPRAYSLGDTLWDGQHLFIASQVAAVSTAGSPNVSKSGNPAKLYRYSYAGGKYTLDSGFPTVIGTYSTESLTIDQDSTGRLWSTWTQVSGDATSGYKSTIYVNVSAVGGTSWQTPFVIPADDPYATADDIAAVVSFQRSKIGVMWSDQSTDTVWWAWRNDAASFTDPSSWHVSPALRGSHQADDHLNLKTLQSDSSGRVFASVKTGLDDAGAPSSSPQLLLLVYKPGTGSFSSAPISTLADCQTRPQVVLNSSTNQVSVFMTGPATSVSGCSYSGVPGAIYRKTTSMDAPAFPAGRGTPVIQDGSSPAMNNVTSSKQPVDATTGTVVLASNTSTKRYWFYDDRAGASPSPSPSPTVTSSPSPSPTVTSSPSPTPTSTSSTGITVGASTSASATTATTAVTLSAPPGLAAGDLLVAQINADKAPTMASVPAGWNPLLASPLSTGGQSTVFVYYRAVVDPASEPTARTWQLSSAVTWGGGITAFHGVSPTSPFDTATVTKVTTGGATSVSLAGVSTTTPGARVIGGVGIDARTISTSPPTGWTEHWEQLGGQTTALSSVARSTPGPTGAVTWTLTGTTNAAAWVRALRPAG